MNEQNGKPIFSFILLKHKTFANLPTYKLPFLFPIVCGKKKHDCKSCSCGESHVLSKRMKKKEPKKKRKNV